MRQRLSHGRKVAQTNMSGRVVAVTGANGGIGRYTALALACLGAHVVLIGRTRQRAEEARAFIRRELPNAVVSATHADLSKMSEVRRLATELITNFPNLSVLINNAGIICRRRTLSEDGFEVTWAVNYLAPFLLTSLLLVTLAANAPARVVNVSSDSHQSAAMEFENLNAERRFWPPLAYGQSKLALVIFTKELARRVQPSKITVNAMHPGLVNTDFGDIGGVVQFGWAFSKSFGLSPRDGAKTCVYLASSPDVADTSGKYFRDSCMVSANPLVADSALASRLWSYSVAALQLGPIVPTS